MFARIRGIEKSGDRSRRNSLFANRCDVSLRSIRASFVATKPRDLAIPRWYHQHPLFATEARYPRIARVREIAGGYEMYLRHRRTAHRSSLRSCDQSFLRRRLHLDARIVGTH